MWLLDRFGNYDVVLLQVIPNVCVLAKNTGMFTILYKPFCFYFWPCYIVQTAPWLSREVTSRFSAPECVETRTWEELAEVMRDKQDVFTSGSLGDRNSANFHVWACFKEHSCLSVISHSDGDAMCYAFHEAEEKWYPMGLSSEVFGACSAQ